MAGDRGKKLRTAHHIVGALVVVGWAIVAWTQLPERRTTALILDDVPPPAGAGRERTYGIYYEDDKIGFAESLRFPTADGGARFEDRARWRFRAQGSVQYLSMDSEAILDPSWGLIAFSSRIDGGVMRLSARGRVVGGALELEVQTAGRLVKERFPLDGPVLVPGVLRAYVAARDPEPGTALSLDIFNPLIRGAETVEVIVEERTAEGWRISEILRGSIKTTAWIDRNGDTLREESFMGFRQVAEPRETALEFSPDSESLPDLVFAASVPVRGEVGDPAQTRWLRVRLDGIEPADFPALAGGRQRLQGSQLEVRALASPDRAPYELPFDGDSQGEEADDETLAELRAALEPAPLVQSDDPEIQKTAAVLVGEERDPVKVAGEISRWVHRAIRKVSSVGVPSAVEVLAMRQGDCNEHTVLFVALARAAGIPARMAAGVVYADVGGGIPGLYYHAWPEVWLGDWIAYDPTFGQIPADATHLRFIVGGLDKQAGILKLIGALRIEVLEASANLPNEAEPHGGALDGGGREEAP